MNDEVEKELKAPEIPEEEKMNVINIPIDKVKPNPWNPNTMNTDVFNALVENVKEIGFVEPIMVVPDAEVEGEYLVISGEHRTEAAKVLGYSTVPAIVREKFDVDMQKFQTVRMNVLKGKMDPVKFTKLFDEMAETYGEEMTKDMMKFVDEKAFKDVYMAVRDELPKDMQDKLDDSKKEIKTVDDLSRILNELFNKYGSSLDQNFMIFTYGGKIHLWVIMEQEFKELLVDNMIEDFKDLSIDASRFFELLVTNHGEETIKYMTENKDGIVGTELEDPDNTEF